MILEIVGGFFGSYLGVFLDDFRLFFKQFWIFVGRILRGFLEGFCFVGLVFVELLFRRIFH